MARYDKDWEARREAESKLRQMQLAQPVARPRKKNEPLNIELV
jgi:hypothetical protein